MKELKMTKVEARLFARRYVESVTGGKTNGSFPIQSENSEIIYIGGTVKSERKFKVRIHPDVDEIRVYEIIDGGNLANNPHLQN